MTRRQTNIKTDVGERAKFVWMWVNGMSARTIALQTGTSVTTIYRWIRRWKNEGSLENRKTRSMYSQWRPCPLQRRMLHYWYRRYTEGPHAFPLNATGTINHPSFVTRTTLDYINSHHTRPTETNEEEEEEGKQVFSSNIVGHNSLASQSTNIPNINTYHQVLNDDSRIQHPWHHEPVV